LQAAHAGFAAVVRVARNADFIGIFLRSGEIPSRTIMIGLRRECGRVGRAEIRNIWCAGTHARARMRENTGFFVAL
jgi:hypothetical protein